MSPAELYARLNRHGKSTNCPDKRTLEGCDFQMRHLCRSEVTAVLLNRCMSVRVCCPSIIHYARPIYGVIRYFHFGVVKQ